MATDTKEKKTKKKVNKHPIAKRKGKKFYESTKKLDKDSYTLKEAVDLLKELSYTSFDGTCEVHVHTSADTKQADQMIRGTIVLPHGTGKSPKIAAFVPEEKEKVAKSAGAEKVGLETLIDEVSKGKIDFDVAVAVPEVMKNIAKVAKTLGQKGLMPNPKSGTVTQDIENTIKEIKLGKVEYRTDKQGTIHCIFGKLSFGPEKLFENIQNLLKAIVDAKPSGIKGTYIYSISLSSTMSPGIRLNVNETVAALK